MSEAPQGREGEAAALRARVAVLEEELAALRRSAAAAGEPLAAREALLKRAERSIHLGSWFYNLETLEVKWSEELFRIFGLDSRKDAATLANYYGAIHPEDRDRAIRDNDSLKDRGVLETHEYRVRWQDGTVREIRTDGEIVRDSRGNMVRVVGTVLDVTERKLLEAQIRQGHKMEAVGRLAAGVAHDFNNLLSIITGNADLLQEDGPDEKVRRIRDAAEVGAALTRQLLAFSRQSVIRPVLLDLGEVARDTARIIERIIGENIRIRLDFGTEPFAVLIDRAQLQQIVLNLAINARDAMPGGGEIRVSAEPAGAGWVRLSVSDSGSGMDEATRARAFEAFFTTKEPGKGTGLGLYAVQDAVLQAGGRITLESAPGLGTEVAIHLPRKESTAAAASPAEVKQGGGSILVVEDHPALRELIRAFLADGGYRVKAVGRPGEAEAAWAEEEGAFDLLVTDLVMPEKSGRALAEGLKAGKPSLNVLYISGYAQGFGPGKKVEGPYLQKPFTRNELLHMVGGILQGSRGNPADGTLDAPAKAPIQG